MLARLSPNSTSVTYRAAGRRPDLRPGLRQVHLVCDKSPTGRRLFRFFSGRGPGPFVLDMYGTDFLSGRRLFPGLVRVRVVEFRNDPTGPDQRTFFTDICITYFFVRIYFTYLYPIVYELTSANRALHTPKLARSRIYLITRPIVFSVCCY